MAASGRLAEGAGAVVDVVRALDIAKLKTTKFAVREPSLDDVFLNITGRPAEEFKTEEGAA